MEGIVWGVFKEVVAWWVIPRVRAGGLGQAALIYPIVTNANRPKANPYGIDQGK